MDKAKFTEIDLKNLDSKSDEQLKQDTDNIKRLIGKAARNEDWKNVMLAVDLLEVVLHEKVNRELKKH